MAHILISSADPHQGEQWKTALTPEHKASLLSGLENIDNHLNIEYKFVNQVHCLKISDIVEGFEKNLAG